ncbi:hypothetical protein [Sphingomonas sp. CCH9-F2]|uniref:hypothetical protein n=1 Tax=Sphingomonas sp. CCH9-F2 TaxID=1768778 RepID=UPI00082DDD77|nr:hypothetical protein [Sphingomonas sp. CCH9-F2]
MPYAALIDWCGPFHTIEAACAAVAEGGYGEALYMAIGSKLGQRVTHVQYVGITGDLTGRFNGKHPIQTLLRAKSLRLYVGIVTSQSVAGKKASHHAKIPLYLAESALAFLLELPLNKDKRCNPPKDSIVVVNRWYREDFATRRRRQPHATWPDLVEYDGYEGTGDIAWHGGRREHVNADMIEEIRSRARHELAKARARKAKAELALLTWDERYGVTSSPRYATASD